jgi:hypothetical protein
MYKMAKLIFGQQCWHNNTCLSSTVRFMYSVKTAICFILGMQSPDPQEIRVAIWDIRYHDAIEKTWSQITVGRGIIKNWKYNIARKMDTLI